MATEKELRKQVADFLVPYLGCVEGGTLHKQLIDMFNASGLCTRYKMTVNDAWCATAVSDAFIGTGLTGIFPCVECGCDNMITLAKKAGIWVEDDAHVPGIGDVILYDWQDSGVGDNVGTPDHVGIVTAVSGTAITVIEGNKDDTVGYRSMTVNGTCIRGYICPDYASAASGGWVQESDGRWWYQNADGSWPASCWKKIAESSNAKNVHWYYFGSSGYMKTGLQTIGGKLYALAPDGGLEGACMITDEDGALNVWYV